MADSKKYDGSQWEHSLRKLTTATEAVENPLYSDGTAITAYTIKGNTVQSGTPTPSNPVEVQGVGNKTANLYNAATVQFATGILNDNGEWQSSTSSQYTTTFTEVDELTTYTLSRILQTSTYFRLYFYDNSKNWISRSTPWYNIDLFTFTTPANCKYIQFQCSNNDTGTNWMLNTGSTAQSYEPYGYKIPISSAGQTIDIYIGDLPLLKSLDGTAVDEISNDTLTRRVDSDGSVLPTPTTTQITMPSIPTTDGANTITIDTTVQPSEFTATWTGWHDASVKEWDGSDWQ